VTAMRFLFTTACCWVAMLAAAPTAEAQSNGEDRVRTINQVAGDLYRVQDGDKTTVFLVTADGIVLVDPLTNETATWLRDEFATRFPGRPVRWVVYTHHHEERASGGLVFKPTASYTGQGRFNGELLAASAALSPALAELDDNHDGLLQPNEIARSPRAATLRARDQNADGVITPGEVYATVVKIDHGFSGQVTITVGAHDVLLTSAPTSYAGDMTVIVFLMQRVAFAADLFPVRSVPRQLGPERIQTLIASMRRVEQLPFDTLLTANGEMLNHADVAAFREYLEVLYAGVRSGRSAGRRLSELQDALTLDKFSQWANFDSGRRANIAEVYQGLKGSAVTLTAGGSYGSESADTCGGKPGCTITRASTLVAAGGVRVNRQRFTAGLQMYVLPREAAHYPKDARIVELQDTIVAIPVGLVFGSAERGVSVTMEGGPAVSRGRTGTTTFARLSFASDTFRTANKTSVGWSAGAIFEMHVLPHVAIAAPVHFVQEGTDATGVRRRRLMVGAAVSIGVVRDYR
jgi:glyoxylase-like metal-dependent hydrolase (beta-lactamase superfamily II)